MKKTFYISLILLTTLLYSQQQQHIPWPSLADSPWPVLRGDMQGTGRSKYVGPRTNNVIWRKDMPLGILYGPVIGYDDVLYMGERALSPANVNYFYAVDKNGNDLWAFQTSTNLPNNSGPIIGYDSTIYFFSATRRMYALYFDGSLKWEQNLWANFRPFYPVAKNGDIYVALTDTIVVVSAGGITKDTLLIPDVIPALVFSTGGDTMFFKTGGFYQQPGNISASDLQGNVYWSHHFAMQNWGIPLVDNSNKLYVFGSDSINPNACFLYCFNPDGTVNWRYQVSYFLNHAAPTIDKNGNILLNARKIINSEERNCIISLDYYGNENWVMPFEGDWNDHYINHGLVCDAEGKVYGGATYQGNFYCIDSSGEILWTLDLGEYEYDSCPAIGSDGTLYIGLHISSLFQNHQQNLIAIRDEANAIEPPGTEILNYRLEQNYPNPFNSATHIRYAIPQSGRVTLKVYDLRGKAVATIVDCYQNRGEYEVLFQAGNLASGIYFYQLRIFVPVGQTGDFVSTKKLLLLK
ncbi:MAG: T9SS type A sorting domain-containing protein [Calditrichia bacterium]|nr:T9SS type A sorting domain-containing protein [Calditrichia bacterium]